MYIDKFMWIYVLNMHEKYYICTGSRYVEFFLALCRSICRLSHRLNLNTY